MSNELKPCHVCGLPTDWVGNGWGGLSPACTNRGCTAYGIPTVDLSSVASDPCVDWQDRCFKAETEVKRLETQWKDSLKLEAERNGALLNAVLQAEAERDALRAEFDALSDLHREICVALEKRGYQAFANEDIGKLIDQITHDHKTQFSRTEQAEKDNSRLRELVRDAVDCWFNHEKRGDYAEMKAMHALRDAIEKEKESES